MIAKQWGWESLADGVPGRGSALQLQERRAMVEEIGEIWYSLLSLMVFLLRKTCFYAALLSPKTGLPNALLLSEQLSEKDSEICQRRVAQV